MTQYPRTQHRIFGKNLTKFSFIFYEPFILIKMGEIIDYRDKDGAHRKVFACYKSSLQDLTFTRYNLEIKEERITSILEPFDPADLN